MRLDPNCFRELIQDISVQSNSRSPQECISKIFERARKSPKKQDIISNLLGFANRLLDANLKSIPNKKQSLKESHEALYAAMKYYFKARFHIEKNKLFYALFDECYIYDRLCQDMEKTLFEKYIPMIKNNFGKSGEKMDDLKSKWDRLELRLKLQLKFQPIIDFLKKITVGFVTFISKVKSRVSDFFKGNRNINDATSVGVLGLELKEAKDKLNSEISRTAVLENTVHHLLAKVTLFEKRWGQPLDERSQAMDIARP